MLAYRHWACVVLMIKSNYEIVLILDSSTQLPKLVDFNIFLFPCLQMISNLVTSPTELEILIQSLSTGVEMNFLKTR